MPPLVLFMVIVCLDTWKGKGEVREGLGGTVRQDKEEEGRLRGSERNRAERREGKGRRKTDLKGLQDKEGKGRKRRG